MKTIRSTISVTGLSRSEAEDGIQDLLEEFGEHPWLLSSTARREADRERLVVTIEREGESLAVEGGDTGATPDEAWDCVIARIATEADIEFQVDASAFVDPT